MLYVVCVLWAKLLLAFCIEHETGLRSVNVLEEFLTGKEKGF